ncbi:ribonuclease D [Methylomagnum ishizawai]|uniref:ribonuclease D n=1 Tax=Methylomagnum ishizawai TaxID=1760988 RepID=UPI001C3207A8|nr:ribonuclease D [Methylomagnum ishizawai]BBL73825.1 ribonuclease D [Methylomagnum ishizawai]
MNAQPHTVFIDSTAHLREFCAALQDADWLAVDTEFLREKTYYPKFCLLQIACGPQVACIDPLAIDDLEPLAALLFDPAITKVFHAGRQDLEIFYQIWNKLPAPIFDTQIAAPLVGLAEQISYAGLVAEILGVSLGKSHTRTDWSLRPLSEAQLRYAADDVIYLGAAYQALRGKLEALGRLDWLEDDFTALLNPELYESPPELAWQRIGGVQTLKSRQLSALRALAAWRETTAREQDIPRNWVVRDEALLDLARLSPTTPEELKRIRGLEERTLKRYGNTLCKTILAGRDQPPPPLEWKARSARRPPEQEALLDLLSAVVRLRAAQHTLNPAILAGRKDLEQLLDEPQDSRLLKGWRKTMAGEELAALLHGECHISVSDGLLHIQHYA